jgi:hypothetical protein
VQDDGVGGSQQLRDHQLRNPLEIEAHPGAEAACRYQEGYASPLNRQTVDVS